MKENCISGNNSLPESARVSIIEWIRRSDDLTHQLFEPESLALSIAVILGTDSTDQFGAPTSPADELARLLLELQDAVSSDDTKRRQAVEMIERAIELCFINAPAYRAALHLYRMELAGELYVGGWRAGALSNADSLSEALRIIIERTETQDARDATDRESREPVSDPLRKRQARIARILDSRWLDERTLEWIEALVQSPADGGWKDEG